MGGNDLNTKKSWHPSLQKNQARVWKEEKNALAERQLIEKLRKEREEERQVEELQRLQEASGGKIATKRVEWMYSGPSGDGAGVTEEREAYLLGKRRIDNLLKDDTQALQKGAAVGIDAVGQPSANLVRDTQKKILEDPLLAIQKQKMEMQIKAAKAAQKAKQYEEKRAKEKDRERRHKHRHHHSRRDRSRSASDDYDERERRHHRSRRDDKDDRHRRRSRSPRRDDRARRDSRDNYRQRTRSRSPYRKSHRDDYRKRSRSRSPRRRDHDNDDRDNHRRRDRSPARRSHDRHEDYHRRPRRPSPPPTKEAAPAGPSAAERLAAMQADASSLEDQRLERLRQLEQDVAAEEEKRRKDKDGKERFLSGVRNKAAGMDLGEAIARGRQGLTKEVDV